MPEPRTVDEAVENLRNAKAAYAAAAAVSREADRAAQVAADASNEARLAEVRADGALHKLLDAEAATAAHDTDKPKRGVRK